MPRYPSEHKVQVRRRILESAGRRLKTDGIDGSGVAVLMKDAGLTNGAFYAHFDSKADLVAAVIADQMSTQVAMLASLHSGPGSAAAYVRSYLSPAHRDDLAGGCPSAALVDEIGRCEPSVRAAYDDGVRRLLDGIAGRLVDDGIVAAPQSWDRAVALYAQLVSTLQLSRAVSDPALSDRILAAGANHAVTLLDTVLEGPTT